MEFEVRTNLALMQPQKIESNIAEVKSWLINALEPYKNMVVSEDAIASAKQDRAKINKLKSAIDEKRKTTKKQWVQPYVTWEAEVNELLGLCDEASGNIDSQIKSFENEIKEQKRAELEKFFNENASAADVDFYINFEMCFNPKWLNSTVKIETAKDEIDRYIEETVDDLKTIADLDSDYNEELFTTYKETHDIKSVLARNKALAEVKKANEARTKPVGEWAASENVKLPWGEETPQTMPKTQEKACEKHEKMYDLLLQLKLTMEQAKNIKRIMGDLGIEIVKSKMKENKESITPNG